MSGKILFKSRSFVSLWLKITSGRLAGSPTGDGSKLILSNEKKWPEITIVGRERDVVSLAAS